MVKIFTIKKYSPVFFILFFLLLAFTIPKLAYAYNNTIYGVTFHGDLTQHDAELIKELNAYIRYDFLWSRIEPEKNNWDFSHYDNLVNLARANGIGIIGILDYGPAWKPAKYPPSRDATTMQEWLEYVENVVSRYRYVKYWEVWNEPNLNSFWYQNANPYEYYVLLKNTYPVIKSVNPNATVILGGLGRSENGIGIVEFLNSLYGFGIKNYFDGLGIHLYVHPFGPNGDRIITSFKTGKHVSNQYNYTQIYFYSSKDDGLNVNDIKIISCSYENNEEPCNTSCGVGYIKSGYFDSGPYYLESNLIQPSKIQRNFICVKRTLYQKVSLDCPDVFEKNLFKVGYCRNNSYNFNCQESDFICDDCLSSHKRMFSRDGFKTMFYDYLNNRYVYQQNALYVLSENGKYCINKNSIIIFKCGYNGAENSCIPEYPKEASFQEIINNVIGVMEQHNDNKEIWITEFGWSSLPNDHDCLNNPECNFRIVKYKQAERYLNNSLNIFKNYPKIKAAIWYKFRDTCVGEDIECNYGLVSFNGSKKPHFFVFKEWSTKSSEENDNTEQENNSEAPPSINNTENTNTEQDATSNNNVPLNNTYNKTNNNKNISEKTKKTKKTKKEKNNNKTYNTNKEQPKLPFSEARDIKIKKFFLFFVKKIINFFKTIF